MNHERQHMPITKPTYTLAALLLVLAACSKTSPTTEVAPASAPVAVASSSTASSPSPATSSTPNGPAAKQDADAPEADESGAAAGAVKVSETGGDSVAETPYGKLSTNNSNVLLLDGKPVSPQIQGSNSLSFVAQVALKSRRAVFVQDNGGTACPALYHWVILSEGSYMVSPEFGSCSDLPKVSTESGKLIVTMPDFVGDFASEAEKKRVAKRTKKYVYDGKMLTENGKPVHGD
ncbi:hypothetical protein [Burkholderia pseudomallei]|uniref:hypothetical protein n=1 Tax=Burkholderia pseudomallei TaxID=28450 RepID=UPI00201AE785|nr:hypothetical protein [Burkholderia pseudomallei]MCL4665527.1 hypothetical protein [Burkholderia pseudomallei]